MASIASLAVEAGSTQVFTARHAEWTAKGKKFKRAALERVFEVMRDDLLNPDKRTNSAGRVRPSMMGDECLRLHALSFLGFTKALFDPSLIGMMDSGTWAHYRFQACGLSAGWLSDIEVPVDYDPWNLHGSMDGEGEEIGLFELKSVEAYKFHGTRNMPGIKSMQDPPEKNFKQFMGYLAARNKPVGSIVYVNRSNFEDLKEFRVPFDKAVFQAQDVFYKKAGEYRDRKELPPILDSCLHVFTGDLISISQTRRDEYEKRVEQCPYGGICYKAKVEHAPAS